MLPLFKSHYSVGKSILTLDDPAKFAEGSSASIFGIASAHELSQIILVEDSLIGFLEAKKQADALGIQLIFGLRLNICDDLNIKITKNSRECVHKLIIFAKDSGGCLLLNKIYSHAETVGNGKIDFKSLKTFYNANHLKIAVPFYDSFLFHNLFSYNEPCLLDDSFFEPTFFLENNLLPFDVVLREAVEEYCVTNTLKTQEVKTIYYEKREDFEAYQTYKCICGRGFSSKAKTLDSPNLDHCGSPEFCFESYLDYERS